MRLITLDTETTGTGDGHRIIEIACVEIIDRRITGGQFHSYVNPERSVDFGAFQIHGISDKHLKDKPLFYEIADDLIDFISQSIVIAHNSSFDTRFLNMEFDLAGKFNINEYCEEVVDSLAIARKRHPGQKNGLDALCKRYHVNNSKRKLHGALLDAQLLAEVYLAMTGGQIELNNLKKEIKPENIKRISHDLAASLKVIRPTNEEIIHHNNKLLSIDKASNNKTIWKKYYA